MMQVQKDVGTLQDQLGFQEEGSTSIDRTRATSFDAKKSPEHIPYTAAEVDQITAKFYTAMDTKEDRLDKRCHDIYFPFDNKIGVLNSQAEWLHKEVKAIQKRLAYRHEQSALIDRRLPRSIYRASQATIDSASVLSIDTESTSDQVKPVHDELHSTQEELKELSAYAYEKIECQQCSIEALQDSLRSITNAALKMDQRWTIAMRPQEVSLQLGSE